MSVIADESMTRDSHLDTGRAAIVQSSGRCINSAQGDGAAGRSYQWFLIGCGVGLALGVIGSIPPTLRAMRLVIADGLKAI